jgi:hypothetical protein
LASGVIPGGFAGENAAALADETVARIENATAKQMENDFTGESSTDCRKASIVMKDSRRRENNHLRGVGQVLILRALFERKLIDFYATSKRH